MIRTKAKTTFSQGASGAVGLAMPTAVAPQREGRRRPPPLKEIIRRMEPFCRKHGITRLEIFGSVARGAARRGSDVDLIATFPEHPGLEIVAIEQACGRLLGVPVHLLNRAAVDEMTNPYRKATIQRDRRTIYAA
jgi:predicted nucleotidyltransferase